MPRILAQTVKCCSAAPVYYRSNNSCHCGDDIHVIKPMLRLDHDSDAPLVRVPIETLDLAPLRRCVLPFVLADKVQSRAHILPGVVVDDEPPWSSASPVGSSVPHEIALRVLSSAHYKARAIRVVFLPAKRPSRLEVYAASSAPARSRSTSLDPLSRYLSSVFLPVGDPIVWSPESALHWPLPPTELVVPITPETSGNQQSVEFIKILLHTPFAHPCNRDQEIVFSQMEVLGTFQLPSREVPAPKSDAHERADTHLLAKLPVNESDAALSQTIRQSLEAAGLSDALIRDLIDAAETAHVCSLEMESPNRSTVTGGSTEVVSSVKAPAGSVLDSPFDIAMREFVAFQAHQDELFASLNPIQLATTMCDTHPNLSRSFCVPRIRTRHRQHYEALATYTFGSFFAQCLANNLDDHDGSCIEGLRLAERLAPLLPIAGLPLELVYEGLLAVVVLALQSDSGVSLNVFHAVLHLVRTVFQERPKGFWLTASVSRGQINTELSAVFGFLLESSHCWSLGSQKTVDRQLLQTMRLLLAQTSTKSSFLRAIWSQDNQADITKTPGSVAVLNRLRVIRWLLQRHAADLSAEDRGSIRVFLETVGTSTHLLARSRTEKQIVLANQCLHLLKTLPKKVEGLDVHLQSLRKHLQDQGHNAANETTTHVALFEAFPLTSTQQETVIAQLQRYFQLHTRPPALYQHTFTPASIEGHCADRAFRKGNVVFKGEAELRLAPSVPFHEQVKQKTQPFEFSSGSTPIGTIASPAITIETSFARFQGTVELRGGGDSSTEETRATTQKPELHASSLGKVEAPPHSKLSRVVPVTPLDAVAQANPTPPTKQPTMQEPLTTEPPRASTAAPALAVPTIPDTTSPIASPVLRPAVVPKSAPAGKTQKSQDAGCVVQ